MIDAAGLASTFGHGLGHGVGLDVHEAPRFSTESTDMLVAGMSSRSSRASTCRCRRLRIEDLVVVTDDGLEILTPSRRSSSLVP